MSALIYSEFKIIIGVECYFQEERPKEKHLLLNGFCYFCKEFIKNILWT